MSIFAQRQKQKRALEIAAPAVADSDALYMVQQCVLGLYDREEPECVTTGMMKRLMAAATTTGVDFESAVAPYFYPLHVPENQIFLGLSCDGTWGSVFFADGHVHLTIFGLGGFQKVGGRFAYDLCSERNVLRLRGIGPYSELLLYPGASKVHVTAPEANVSCEMHRLPQLVQ